MKGNVVDKLACFLAAFWDSVMNLLVAGQKSAWLSFQQVAREQDRSACY